MNPTDSASVVSEPEATVENAHAPDNMSAHNTDLIRGAKERGGDTTAHSLGSASYRGGA